MEKHPILYEYYSKYDGGNPLNRIALAVPRVVKSATSKLASHAKEFATDTGKIVIEGLLKDTASEFAKEALQGNNPYTSFMKNIKKRIEDSNESKYAKMMNDAASHKFPPLFKLPSSKHPKLDYNDFKQPKLDYNNLNYDNYLKYDNSEQPELEQSISSENELKN